MIRVSKPFGFAILFVGLATLALNAQDKRPWCFGSHVILNFNNDFPEPGKSLISSKGGSASIYDTIQQILYYTDGRNLWDGSNQLLVNDLAGSSESTQSSVMLNHPDRPDLVYILTTDTIAGIKGNSKGLCYSIWNKQLNGFAEGKKNVKLVENAVEKIAATRHSNGRDYWILSHDINNSRFQIFLLTKDGISFWNDPVIGLLHHVNINEISVDLLGGKGYMKFSPNGKFLALAIEGSNRFEVFRFAPGSGVLSDPRQIDFNGGKGAYGVEFSPSGDYLFGSNRQTGEVFRWDLREFNESSIKASGIVVRQPGDIKCGALQLAANCKIYVALNQSNYIGVIENPDAVDLLYKEQGVNLNKSTDQDFSKCGFGLPNFPSDEFYDDIYFSGSCQGSEVYFYTALRDQIIEKPLWLLEGQIIESDSSSYGAYFTFPGPGKFQIKMIANINGLKVEKNRFIIVQPIPKMLEKDHLFICRDSIQLIQDGLAFWSWSLGTFTDTSKYVNGYGIYTILRTNYEGCSVSETISVLPSLNPVEKKLIKPASCNKNDDGEIEIILKGSSSDYDIRWLDNANVTTFSRNSLPSKWYFFIITNPETKCTYRDSVFVDKTKIHIDLEKSVADMTKTCPGDTIILTATGALNFDWGDLSNETSGTIKIFPRKDVMIKVIGYDRDPGVCSGEDSVNIEVLPDYKLNLGDDRTFCNGEILNLSVMDLVYYNNYKEWTWWDGSTSTNYNVSNSIQNFWLRVKDVNDCVYRDTLNIGVVILPEFTIKKTPVRCYDGSDGRIEIYPVPENGQLYYSIKIDSDWSDSSVFENLVPGDYFVRIKDKSEGCISQPQEINISQPDPITFKYRVRKPYCLNCTDGQIILDEFFGGIGPYYYDNHLITGDLYTVDNLSPGTYQILVKDSHNCESTVTKINIEAGEFFVPNAFSPNEEGTVNQTWVITSLDGWNNSFVRVYDKQGELVYESRGEYQPWDGTYKNLGLKKMPAGSYYYIILIEMDDLTKPAQRGIVTIVR